ncbi:MAG: NAD(P)/FAD-dependent oxidoreductase, partial [Thermacetogeniaceae bacterium]
GAGTFSDGKLTTLIRDPRCRKVLEEFVEAGAPKEILYLNKPHIGTDLLLTVIKNIRQRIIANGGEFRFRAKVTDLEIRSGRIAGVVVNGEEVIPCEVVLLGIGHSARDTFAMLHRRGVVMTQKPFSIGVRIEHPQALIDAVQYGDFAGDPRLGAADYKLVYHSPKGRSAYTFCMCPGGYVIAAASEAGGVVTNGMSEYRRDGKNANSALLVGVGPGDYGSDHPLAGVEFQRRWEGLAFELAGSNYRAPVQLVGDFLLDRPSTQFGAVNPTYRPGVAFVELKHCLPPFVIETLREAIQSFDTKIPGFAMADAVLTGVETRSSSPVRIVRDEGYLSNIEGLYPIGEGAGYAGGIMSAAVDGIKAAEKVAEKYSPLC